MTSDMQTTLEAAIPKSLDEIIKSHRDECSIRLSIDEDLVPLVPMISLHILEQREHPFWANVNSDSEGT